MQLNFKKIGEGTPLIILHGLFGSLDNWMTIAKELGKDFEVYILDARNHGQSPHDDVFNYQVMVEDLKEFIEEHRMINPIILGHSMGGKTAMQFAVDYPHLISKLIVVDIAPKAYPIHHDLIINSLKSLNFNEIKTRKEAEDKLAQYIFDLSTRQFLLKNLYWVAQDQLAFRFNLGAISKNIDEVGAEIEFTSPFYQHTLFIRGDHSNYILDSDFEQIFTIFPNAQIKTIENSGHWVHAEQPFTFLSLVKAFLLRQ
ncbi:MAG: alpha/beta fold hydrolase [Bacteroidetes bacterium]|nr:alpha/beta fold hydrolase [Bacteroidota bacterium]